MSAVETPFLHMLPEVYLLPDVRVFRFNIDSSYGLFTWEPAGAGGSICASEWSVEKFKIQH